MRKSLLILLSALLFQACSEEQELRFSQQEIITQECGSCPLVKLRYHQAEGNSPAATSINRAIREELIANLHFRDDLEVNDLQSAIHSFSKTPEELPLEPETPWEADIETRITHQDEKLITLALELYIFTGGAHGIEETRYLNFDKSTGDELESWELFHDNSLFERFAEKEFRRQENIPVTAPINSTGFMFPNNRFDLPDNIGYSKEGVVLHYNPYEVASYSEGPVVITIPFAKARKYLSRG